MGHFPLDQSTPTSAPSWCCPGHEVRTGRCHWAGDCDGLAPKLDIFNDATATPNAAVRPVSKNGFFLSQLVVDIFDAQNVSIGFRGWPGIGGWVAWWLGGVASGTN